MNTIAERNNGEGEDSGHVISGFKVVKDNVF